jgi:hypothetical protein
MVLRKTFMSLVALGALTCVGLMHAQAQSTQLNFTGGVFNFSGSTFSETTDVIFNFATINGVQTSFATPFQAQLTLSGTIGTASEYVNNGKQIGVLAGVTGLNESITAISSESGITAGQQLVGFTGGSATLGGVGKTISLTLGTNTSLFKSDVFALAGPENTTLQLNANQVLSVSGSTATYGTLKVTTGSLNAFTATGKSNVFNAASVPEASTLIGFGGLLLGGGFFGLRRRKA